MASIPMFFVVTLIIFTAIEIIPGDAVNVIYGLDEGIDNATRQAMEQRLGLDQSLPVRYLLWLGRLIQGDFGSSYISQFSVGDIISSRIPPTLLLSIISILMALLFSIPLGVMAAADQNGIVSYLAQAAVLISSSFPSFLIGIILLVVFSLNLGWLPSFGYTDPFQDFVDALRHVALPALTLAIPLVAIQIRLIRDNLIHELDTQDYIQIARMKGLREREIIWKHALRNVLLPVITATSLWVGSAISGSVVIETVFTWPGLGYLLYKSVLNRDLPMVQGITVVITFTFILINLITDLIYGLIDPRIRKDSYDQ